MKKIQFITGIIVAILFWGVLQQSAKQTYAYGPGVTPILCDPSKNGNDGGMQQCLNNAQDVANHINANVNDYICEPSVNTSGVCRLTSAYCDVNQGKCYFSCQPQFCPAGLNGTLVCGVCANGMSCGTPPTPTPTATPIVTDTPTPTTGPTATPTNTPTPTECVAPGQVLNVHVTCPYCGTNPTPITTVIPTPSLTPIP